MASSIRLITDEATVYIASIEKDFLIEQRGAYIVPRPKGKSIIVGFVQHTLDSSKEVHPIVTEAIAKDIGTVYLCDKLPDNPIISPYVVYVSVQWKWFVHTLFFNPLLFKACFSSQSFRRLAEAFSSFTKYNIPFLDTLESVAPFAADASTNSNNVVVEIMGGLGDHLISIPAIKTLAKNGQKVSVLCEKHLLPCFSNLDYIENFYQKREEIDVSKFDRVIHLNFGQLLNDYRIDLNKQNRIYSIGNVCGLKKEEMAYDTPEIRLSEEEKEEAYKLYRGYNRKIFFGWDSNRSDTRIPHNVAQRVISRLHSQGFTVFVSSLRELDFKDCVNLNKKLNLRQLFMLISQMDYMLTVDSSFLHISAAFKIKTFLLMNYFDPSWRCSTYPYVKAYTPKVKCFPCVAGQFVCGNDRVCNNADSCFNYFNWDSILTDIYNCKVSKKISPVSINEELNKDATDNFPMSYLKKDLKLLINRTSGFGDILMITSVVNSVKKANPSAHITLRTNHPRVLTDIPAIEKIIATKFAHVEDLSCFNKEYDLIMDLQYAVESKKVSGAYGKITEDEYMNEDRIDLLHKFVGIPQRNTVKLSYTVTDLEKLYARNIISKLKHKNTVAVSLNSTSAFRTYPIDLCIDMIKLLLVKSNVICLGNIDKMWGNEHHPFNKYYKSKIKELHKDYFLDLSDKTSIRQACALVSEADVLITPDSGLLHLANAVGTKTVALFGNINPYLRCAFYGNTVPLSANLSCLCGDRFCNMRIDCPSFSEIEDSKIRRVGADCMRFIKPKDILNTVNTLLSPDKHCRVIYREYLLQFCEGEGVLLGKCIEQKVNNGDSIIEDIDTLETISIRNNRYVLVDKYLTTLNSEYAVIEVLKKVFNFVRINGTVIIKDKIPFISEEVSKEYHHNFCLLYIKKLLKRAHISFALLYKVDLLPNGEFMLVLRKTQ